MSDEKDKQSAAADKPNEEAAKSSLETDKAKVEADKPSAESAKPNTEAAKPAAEAAKPSTEAAKPAAEPAKPSAAADKPSGAAVKTGAQAGKLSSFIAKRTKTERILLAALVLVVFGFIYALFHSFEVMQQAQNPYSQSAGAAKPIRPASESELEREEAKFQPKAVAPASKEAIAAHDRLYAPNTKVTTKAPAASKPNKAK